MAEPSKGARHSCLKLELPVESIGAAKEAIFVKGTWSDTHFVLSITDGFNAWTCTASESEVSQRAEQWDQPVSEYVALAERYLGFQQPGSHYGFEDAGNGQRRLSWTFEKQGTKLEWRWKCQPSSDSKQTTAAILDFLMDANIRLSMDQSRMNMTVEVPKKKLKAMWTDETVRIFIDICCEEVLKGNRSTANFGKAWKDILSKFNSAMGLEYNEKQLKNKLNSLKDDWKIWRALVGKKTGLGFKDGVIQADPKWWDRKIQEVEGAAKFRGKPLPFEAEMDYLFSDTVSIGGRAWAPTSRVQTPDTVQSTQLPQPSRVNIVEGSADSDDVVMETQLPTPLPTTQLPTASVEDRKGKKIGSARSASGKRKACTSNDLHDTISEIKTIMTSHTSRGAATDKLHKLYGIKNMMQILKSLPGINLKSPAFMQACKAMRSATTREVFVELDDVALQRNLLLSLVESYEENPLFFSN